jgi:hypothetical protein
VRAVWVSFDATGRACLEATAEDITGTLERKLAAFACFETEVREHPHPRSERACALSPSLLERRSASSTLSPSCSAGI